MAVTQDGRLQQPMEAPQPAQANPAGQAQNPGSTLSQSLERQISQAIEPVLDEFRRQMSQTLDQELKSTPTLDQDGHSSEAPSQQQTQQPAQQEQQTQQPAQQEPSAQQQTPLGQPQTSVGDLASQPLEQIQRPLQNTQNTLQSTLTDTLRPTLETVERQSEEWLTSMLVAALAGLLTETTRRFIQQYAENGLHTLTQKLFEAAPGGIVTPEMSVKVEQTLQVILRDSLSAIFTEGVRVAMQQGGQTAIHQSLHGDFSGAVKGAEETLKQVSDALFAVLRQHWSTLLRLTVALILLALDAALAQSEHPEGGGAHAAQA